jgi:hypothetical protein
MSSQILSTFSVILLVLARLSSSTDTQPALKRACHSKTTVRLKECSPKASRSISRFSVAVLPSFTQKFDADTLLDFSIHHRQNQTQSPKSTHVKKIHVHSTVSCGRLMQYACESETLGSPLIFFHRGSHNNNNPGTFGQNLVFVQKTMK